MLRYGSQLVVTCPSNDMEPEQQISPKINHRHRLEKLRR